MRRYMRSAETVGIIIDGGSQISTAFGLTTGVEYRAKYREIKKVRTLICIPCKLEWKRKKREIKKARNIGKSRSEFMLFFLFGNDII